MKVLVFDISTTTGWAYLEGEIGRTPTILETGIVSNDGPVSSFGDYPFSFCDAADSIAQRLGELAAKLCPDIIVIEETNRPGRFTSRYSQKILEYAHYATLFQIRRLFPKWPPSKIAYVNTSDWRRIVGANLTKADKALNVKVRKLKKAGDKEGLKKLGARGKFGKKHAALRYVNLTFGLDLKMKDNDIADAICQGTAYFLGATPCDGK